MAKRACLYPENPKEVEVSHEVGFNLKDRISELPDEILVYILSSLTVREAGVTSILSRRWKDLWASISCLDFEPSSIGVPGRKYANWLNSVVCQHKAPIIDKFRIALFLGQRYADDIDSWISFALSKKVQKLELCFSNNYWGNDRLYTFLEQLPPKSRGASVANELQNVCTLQTLALSGLTNLRVLFLAFVKVKQEALDYVLMNCAALERLTLDNCPGFVSVKISGSAVNLKYLKLTECCNLESVELCDANITRFTLHGWVKRLLFKNVPHLVRISLDGDCYGTLNSLFDTISSCLTHLESLRLNECKSIFQQDFLGIRIPKFVKLTRLVIYINFCGEDSLLGIFPLIEASPYLKEFELKLGCWDYRMPVRRRRMREGIRFSHRHLKTMKIAMYCGCSCIDEFVLWLMKVTIALEKIIIDPEDRGEDQKPPQGKATMPSSRSFAQLLQAKVPPRINFIIL